jgi:signal transduction protein with GAF and PtsI domain
MDIFLNINTIGEVFIEDIFVYYDRPLLFSCVSTYGKTYLVLLIDSDEKSDTWLFSEINLYILNQLIKKIFTIREILKETTNNNYFIVEKFHNEKFAILNTSKQISDDLLPDENIYIEKIFDYPNFELQYLNVLKIREKNLGDSFEVSKNYEKISDFYKKIGNINKSKIYSRKAREAYYKDDGFNDIEYLDKVLSGISNEIVGRFDMNALLNQIIKSTLEILKAEECSIFLKEIRGTESIVKCVAGSGFAENIVEIAEYKIGKGFTGSIAKYGGEYNIKNFEELKNLEINGSKVWRGMYDDYQWEKTKRKFRNLIALPLKSKGQIIGVIKAENKIVQYGNSFTKRDLVNLKITSNVISLAIENTKMYMEIKKELSVEVVEKLTSAVVGQFNKEHLLNSIIDTTLKTLNAEVCTIFLFDEESDPNYLVCRAQKGFSDAIIGNLKYKKGEGLTGTIGEYGYEFNIKSERELNNLEIHGKRIKNDSYYNKKYTTRKNEFKNLIAVPLRIREEIIGVIKAENKVKKFGGAFSEDELSKLRIMASIISLGIENLRLNRRAEMRSMRLIEALREVADSTVGNYTMNELYDEIIKTIEKTLNAEVCSIFLDDKKNPDIISCVAGSGFAEKIVGKAKYKIGNGFTGSIAKYGEVYNIKSYKELADLEINGMKIAKFTFDDLQWQGGKNTFRNLIALPLKIKEEIIGVIKVENKKEDYGLFFDKEDENIFKIIANVVALTIKKTRLQMVNEEQLTKISLMTAHKINNILVKYDIIENKYKKLFEYDNISNEEFSKVFDDFNIVISSIKRMVDDFQKYGQPINLEKELTNINEMIKKEVSLIEGNNTIEILTNLKDNVPDVWIDNLRISESISELINNAMNVLKINNIKGKIIIETEHIRNSVLIRVKDNGPGFPSTFKVFTPFKTTIPDGTGLGLVTVKNNIEAHGGRIELITKEEEGSCFEITLPIPKENTNIEIIDNTKNIKIKRVLIIDDNEDITSYLKKIFEEGNYIVKTASKFEEGKSEILNRIFDYIIIDIKLDKSDYCGIELYKLVGEKQPNAETVMFSAYEYSAFRSKYYDKVDESLKSIIDEIKNYYIYKNSDENLIDVISRKIGFKSEEEPILSNFYALLIAVNNYNNSEEFPSLQYPLKNMRDLKNILLKNYMFKENTIKLLENPKRDEVIDHFCYLQENLNEGDNLLVFFAGHGFINNKKNHGYWVFSDSKIKNWISNSDVRSYISDINTKHTLLVSDSCYSGNIISRGNKKIGRSKLKSIELIKRRANIRSRKAITSGDCEQRVPDKSLFIEYMIKNLKNNKSKYYGAIDLYCDTCNMVKSKETFIEQNPLYDTIIDTDDYDDGEFFFVKK